VLQAGRLKRFERGGGMQGVFGTLNAGLGDLRGTNIIITQAISVYYQPF
jgi:hypothetical protein